MRTTNKIKLVFVIFATFGLLGQQSHAELNKHDQEALQKTQDFLRSKTQREQNLKTNKEAQPYVQKMNQMGMNAAHQDTTFNITADVFADVLKANQGDPDKLQKMLMNAQKDPQGFYNSLSQDQKDKIRSLGRDIGATTGAQAPK